MLEILMIISSMAAYFIEIEARKVDIHLQYMDRYHNDTHFVLFNDIIMHFIRKIMSLLNIYERISSNLLLDFVFKCH